MNKFVYGGQDADKKNMEQPKAVEETSEELIEPPSGTGDSDTGEDDTGGIEAPEWQAELKELQPQVKITPRNLKEWGLPVRDGRQSDWLHYAKELNEMERTFLLTKMREFVDN